MLRPATVYSVSVLVLYDWAKVRISSKTSGTKEGFVPDLLTVQFGLNWQTAGLWS